MSKLQRLYAEQGQSPWPDNLTRGYLRDGTLARLVGDGIRGVTANPTIFARAIEGSSDYASAPTTRWHYEARPRSPRRSSPTGCSSSGSPASGGNASRYAAHRQRPLWASTSTKNPAYPDILYVDELIGPDTVNTLPETTIAAFEDHGRLARTLDTGAEEADQVMRRLATVGIDMDDVGLTLEDKGVAGFHESFQRMLAGLAGKAHQLSRR